MDHGGEGCECLSSDNTGAEGAREEDSRVCGVDFSQDCGLADLDTGRLGSVPFVSHRPGAYGRLLLVVYVRWKTGFLVASDWLRPVTRGGAGGRAAPPVTTRSVADVS